MDDDDEVLTEEEVRMRERMTAFARTFPSMRYAAGVEPWDAMNGYRPDCCVWLMRLGRCLAACPEGSSRIHPSLA
jgi:hypothetical protein